MQSHELLQAFLHRHNVKVLSEKMGLSVPRLYKWAEPSNNGGSGTPNPLDRVAALVSASGDTEPLEWLCAQGGGYFVSNKQHDIEEREKRLLSSSSKLLTQFAEMVALLAETAEDGRITPEEAKRIRATWTQIQSRTEAYVRKCELGHFREP
jgi:hypothetical protein